MNDRLVLTVILLVAVAALVLLFLLARRRRSSRADSAVEFEFSSPEETNRQQFIYEVAGLIKAATGLETRTVALGKYKNLDIEVHRGMRCVGVVSVVPPGQDTAMERVQAIARVRNDKQVKTAYVVTGGAFSDSVRRRAKSEHITLLDGAALRRIRRKAEVGGYAKSAAQSPEPTKEDAKRWRQPPRPAPVHPAAVVEPSLDVTQRRENPKPPWVEFR